ncbi:MAG: HAD family hydrolase [Candidatus Heimdallarchaeota archaeon]|nr:HAD family hydrolase [Candidatus Heimdallarchaeota archaeon]
MDEKRIMIKMITLDFDGTTADTMPTLEKIAIRLMTNHYKLEKEDARTKYRSTTGLPFEQQMEILFPENKENKLVVENFEKEKIESIFDLPLFDDAIETITSFRKMGYLVAISSSTTQPIIEKYCKMKGLEVDQILGYKPGFEKGKDHFDFLINKFKLENSEIIYVGDSLKDCERAQKSEILFVGRIGMFNQEQFNQISKSKLYIHELSDLEKILQKV